MSIRPFMEGCENRSCGDIISLWFSWVFKVLEFPSLGEFLVVECNITFWYFLQKRGVGEPKVGSVDLSETLGDFNIGS